MNYGGTNYSAQEILGKSFLDGFMSATTYLFMSNINIPKFNSGRGSYAAISKQITTKLSRKIISKISIKTFSKMFAYEFYLSFLDMGVN